MSLNDCAITTEKLCKKFGSIVAIDNLDLKITRGTIYGLIGPNGSGKTTTIRVLVGLLRPTSGTAIVLGEPVPIRSNLATVSYMPQETAVYTDLTVGENLRLFANLYSLDKDLAERRIKDLLEMVELADRKDSVVSELSGGMKHRVSLASSLVNDPDLVFLDEPTVGVDPELRAGFWDYFESLKSSGKTIVMTTHYMDEAGRCDRVGMMRSGKLIAEGSPKELTELSGTSGLEDAFIRFAREVST